MEGTLTLQVNEGWDVNCIPPNRIASNYFKASQAHKQHVACHAKISPYIISFKVLPN